MLINELVFFYVHLNMVKIQFNTRVKMLRTYCEYKYLFDSFKELCSKRGTTGKLIIW